MTRQLITLSAPIPESGNPDDTDSWGVTEEEFHEAVDRAVGGNHDVVTTGGTTNLTSEQNDVVQLFVSGTLVSNATIKCQARPKWWIVQNGTAGAFTLSFRVTGDIGTTVVINQSRTAIVFCDGADCFLLDLATMSGTPASVSGPVEYPLGSAGSPSITFTGDTNTGIFSPGADAVGISTGGTERWRVDSTGLRNRAGAQVAFGESVTPFLQVLNTAATASIGVARYSADANPAHIRLAKSRNAAVGSHTILQSADSIGAITFDISDGTNFIPAAGISAIVNGTPGTNDAPGALVFYTTADGAAVLAESARLDANAFFSLDGDVDTGLQNGGANILNAYTGGTLRLSLDASGRVMVGGTGIAVTFGNSIVPMLQVAGTGATSGIGIGQFSADAVGGKVAFFKSRNATVNSLTATVANDVMGTVEWGLTEGTNRYVAASIAALVDGTPGTTDAPGRLVFSVTADGSATLTEAWRIANGGQLISGQVAAQATELDGNSLTPRLQVHGTGLSDSAILIASWSSTTAQPPTLNFARAKGGTIGTFTVVATNDPIGVINFASADGTNFEQSAYIKAENDAAPGADDAAGRIVFGTTADGAAVATRRATIDAAGRFIIGDSAANTIGNSGALQVVGTGASGAAMSLQRYSADAGGPTLSFAKSRNASAGGNTIVQAGDLLGAIYAYGADGANFDTAAAIEFTVATGVGAGTDMPGKISLQTSPDGSATPVERVGIDSTRSSFSNILNLFPTAATIVSGAITVTSSHMTITPEGGAADDLATINGGSNGDFLIIRNATANDITIVESGNIDATVAVEGVVTPLVLGSTRDSATFIYTSANIWLMIAYSINN